MKTCLNCSLLAISLLISSSLKASDYNPLAIKDFGIDIIDYEVVDPDRERTLPIRLYVPKLDAPAAIVLFSHGLGGSSKNNSYLGNHWAGRGYVAVFLQHPGSDESVWKEVSAKDRFKELKKAASYQNAQDRLQDVPRVIDQLELWNTSSNHALYGKLNLDKIGMSGHSFGALTTQWVSGQSGLISKNDARIDAAVMFSPSIPKRGSHPKAFAAVDIPWLLMTGTEDVAAIGNTDVASRLAVYPALPEGDKYELVFEGGTHSAFSERALGTDKGKRNPNHHTAILALSTAFWDSYLKDDLQAKAWLQSDVVTTEILESKDRWQMK